MRSILSLFADRRIDRERRVYAPAFRSQIATPLRAILFIAVCFTFSGCGPIRTEVPAPPDDSVAVNISGSHVQLSIRNADAYGPTVVFLSGHGALGIGWEATRTALGSDVKSVWIDRPGLGWSEPLSFVESPKAQLVRLRSALRNAQLPPPYLFVGHSLGGAFAMRYAQEFESDIAGLVLVSPPTPELFDDLPHSTVAQVEHWVQLSSVLPLASSLGILALIDPMKDMLRDLPEREARWARAFANSQNHLRATATEARLLLPGSELMQDLRGWAPSGHTPLTLIYETEPIGAINAARARQATAWKRAFGSRVEAIRMQGATHIDMITKPAHARIVANAIRGSLKQREI
jgi:pimeloyl-ACP methyl ester carboxylesterase